LNFIETTVVTPASRLQPDSRRDGGVTAAAVSPPPLQKAERRSALQSADLKVGATMPLSYRVKDKMRLAKDHRSLKVNDSLTLGGIPPETFEYRLGNRSALEWVIDQYRVTRDEKGNIASDPNRLDDEQYILRLLAQVITVSLETMKLVRALPELKFE
jgi:predicted helicase